MTDIKRIPHHLVGWYSSDHSGNWFADVPLGRLGYAIRLRASGTEPTQVQLDRFKELVTHLALLVAESGLGDMPPGTIQDAE